MRDGSKVKGRDAALRGWRVLLLVLIVGVLIGTSFVGLRGTRARKSDSSARLVLESTMTAKAYFLQAHLPPLALAGDERASARLPKGIADARKQMLDRQSGLVKAAPTPLNLRKLAIMEHEAGDPGWANTVVQLAAADGAAGPFEIEQEQDLWRRAFRDGLKPGEVPAALALVRGMQLGWYENVAARAIYESAGMHGEEARATRRALRSTYMLAGLNLVYMLAALAGGAIDIVLCIFYFVYVWKRPGYTVDDLAPVMRKILTARPQPLLDAAKARVLYAVFLTYLGTFLVLRVVLQLLVARMGRTPSITEAMLLTLLQAVVAFGVPLAVMVWRGRPVGLQAGDIGWRTNGLLADMLWGVGGYVVSLPLLLLVAMLSGLLFKTVDTPLNPAVTQFATSGSLIMQFLLLVEAAVMAPIVEETLFRGVFFRSISPWIGRIGGIVGASAVFAILHPQLPLGFLSIFVLGATFNVLYAIRGSLVPNMTAHAINNGAIFLLLSAALGK